MNKRDAHILESALAVFARYGTRKTTMNDIAQEAGVARQTLYNAYASKDDVLRAAVRYYAEMTYSTVTEAWGASQSIEQKLDRFFECVPLKWYDAVQDAPDAADLIDGIHKTAGEELKSVGEKWKATLADLFKEHAPQTSVRSPGHTEIAEYFYSTALNAKYSADTRQVLEVRLQILKASTLALLDLSRSV